MKKVFNKIIREDLDLNKYWWHRFFKVIFFVFIAMFFIVVGFVTWNVNEPWHENYYEVVGKLGSYIYTHANKSFVSLSEFFDGDTFVVNANRFDEKIGVGDLVTKPYGYNYSYPRLLTYDNNDIYALTNMQCKKGMTVDDVMSYKSSHTYDTKYYSYTSSKCEPYPTTDFLLQSAIRKNLEDESDCIFSKNNCMITVGREREFMEEFVVIDMTENALKYSNGIYLKSLISGILKTIFITVGTTVAVFIILLLLYYKGFIYIVYGSKKK